MVRFLWFIPLFKAQNLANQIWSPLFWIHICMRSRTLRQKFWHIISPFKFKFWISSNMILNSSNDVRCKNCYFRSFILFSIELDGETYAQWNVWRHRRCTSRLLCVAKYCSANQMRCSSVYDILRAMNNIS